MAGTESCLAWPGTRVLVVEDDTDVLRLLVSHLTALGCQVAEAGTGEDGLRQALAAPPDVAIVDVRLPGMSGHDVVRAMREDARTSGCRVVITSVIDREDLVAAKDSSGSDAILPKPFTRRDVRSTMHRLLTGGEAAPR